MKSAIFATIMVLTFASSVEAKREGGSRRRDGPFVGCIIQAEDAESTFEGKMRFRTKTDRETGIESLG